MRVTVRERRFPSATGLGAIRFRQWLPEEPCAALQITHGMAEHIDRYDAFARYLAGQGVLVYGQDHAGHGKSTPDAPRGFFGQENGVDALLQDMRTLYELVKRDHPAIPFILFGHSMGSLLARAYASRDGEDFDAFIFCGTAGRPAGLAFARFIARREARRAPDRPSRLLERLCFGGYNRAVGSSRTAFDWLSRDAAEVDRYVTDPACGFTFTAAGMRDVLDALLDVCGTEWASRVPDAPILLASGDCDPVGGRGGGGVRQAAGWLRQSGHGTVELKLYPGARHELLNETNRDEVYGDIALFIETVETMGAFA